MGAESDRGVPPLQVSTADYVVRVQDKGKDFQVTTKTGQLIAEVCSPHLLDHMSVLAVPILKGSALSCWVSVPRFLKF